MPGLTLTSRELAALRTVADPAHVDEPGPVLPWSMLAAVKDLVGADEVELDQTDPEPGWLGFLQSLEGRQFLEEEPHDPHFWELWRRSQAKIYARSGPNLTRITTLSDFVSDRQWRRDPIFVDYVLDSGLFHEIGVNLPEASGRCLRLHCLRSRGRDFGEKERFYLTLLRPHLVLSYLSAVTPRPSATLTARQQELLRYVAAGLTNHQIARRIGIAEGTVRRHLNNIYERLGVTSRTAAVMQVAQRSSI